VNFLNIDKSQIVNDEDLGGSIVGGGGVGGDNKLKDSHLEGGGGEGSD